MIEYLLNDKFTIGDMLDFLAEILKQHKAETGGVPLTYDYIKENMIHVDDKTFIKRVVEHIKANYENQGGYPKFLLDYEVINEKEFKDLDERLKKLESAIQKNGVRFRKDCPGKELKKTKFYHTFRYYSEQLGISLETLLQKYNIG